MAADVAKSGFGLYPYVSQSALSAILKDIRDNGLPTAQSRRGIKRVRELDTRVSTTHGPLFREVSVTLNPRSDPTSHKLEYIDPASILSHAFASCSGFGDYLESKLIQHPPSSQHPWGIIIYSDEINPGNQLKHDNQRKTQAIYWSFVQYGSQGLCREASWFVLSVVRSGIVTEMGGMSVLLRHLLEAAFVGNINFRHGVSLHRGGRTFILFATIKIFVADERALKETWDVKGASGTLPCMFCRNVVLHRSSLHTFDSSGYLVSMVEHDFSRFVLHSDASFKEAFQTLSLQHGTLTGAAWNRLEQSLGLNYNTLGLLASNTLGPELNPISGTMFDWMHVYCVAGIMNVECGLLLHVLSSQAGISHRQIHDFMQTLNWPAHAGGKGCTGKDVFRKRASATANEILKCSASEMLCIYSPLRYFLVTLRPPANSLLEKAIQSYFCVARVLDLLTELPKGLTTPLQLKEAIEAHMVCFLRAYEPDWIHPKHHFAMHLHRSFEEHSLLVSCWVHERKHKEIKKFANNLSNTSGRFESSILESVLQVSLATISDPGAFPSTHTRLILPKAATANIQHVIHVAVGLNAPVEVSNEVVCVDGLRCSRGDVVVFEIAGAQSVGEVWIHASVADQLVSCVSKWQPLGRNQFRVSDDSPVVIPTCCIHRACVYFKSNDAVTVIPSSSM